MRSCHPRSWLWCWVAAGMLWETATAQPSLARAQLLRQGPEARPRVETGGGVSIRTQRETRTPTLARAHDHFVLGQHFYLARNYREALREFELAAALLPSAEIWLHIGRTREELGEYAQAISAFAHYLRERPEAADAAAVRAQVARLEALAHAAPAWEAEQAKLGSLRIHSRSSRAQVFLDGRLIEPEARHSPVLLPAGRHRFDVVDASHIPMRAMVDIQPGLLTTAYADLQPTTRARMRPAAHGLDFVLFGVAGAGALATATFAAVSAAERSGGSQGSAEAWAQRTDLALAGTALCALAAALVYYGAERSAQTQISSVLLGPK